MDTISDHYKKGDPYPPRADVNVVRIYTYKTSGFGERVQLVLSAKGIKNEVINVNMLEKPEWLLERNPIGKVPVIEFDSDNKVLTESLVISEFLDEHYSNKRQLRAKDPYQRAKDRVFVELISTIVQNGYGFALQSPEAEFNEFWSKAKEEFKNAEQLLKNRKTAKFLSGNVAPGLADYMIWPFIERLPIAVEVLTGSKADDYIRTELPTIHEYMQQMLSDNTIKNVCDDYQLLLSMAIFVRQMIHSKK